MNEVVLCSFVYVFIDLFVINFIGFELLSVVLIVWCFGSVFGCEVMIVDEE